MSMATASTTVFLLNGSGIFHNGGLLQCEKRMANRSFAVGHSCRFGLVIRLGLEPRAHALKGHCSTS